MKIQTAESVISAASPSQFPAPILPEVAFAGKSNVGKSSLINSLPHRKGLVKTSGTPGKTRLINFFNINGRFHLVDLPGYGFAKVPFEVKAQWEALVSAYLLNRAETLGVVMILDARHPPTDLDRVMKKMLDRVGLPCLMVANKVDKLKRSQLKPNLKTIANDMQLSEIPLAYSANTHAGRPQLWERLESWLTGAEGGGAREPSR